DVRDPDRTATGHDRNRSRPDTHRRHYRVRAWNDARDRLRIDVGDPHRPLAGGDSRAYTTDRSGGDDRVGRGIDAGDGVVLGVRHPDRACPYGEAGRSPT